MREPTPELPCKRCTGNCSILISSQYCLEFMDCWINGQPIPECTFFKELSFHGLEGVRP